MHWKVLLEEPRLMEGKAVTAADPSEIDAHAPGNHHNRRPVDCWQERSKDARKILHTLRDLCAANLDLMALLSKKYIN